MLLWSTISVQVLPVFPSVLLSALQSRIYCTPSWFILVCADRLRCEPFITTCCTLLESLSITLNLHGVNVAHPWCSASWIVLVDSELQSTVLCWCWWSPSSSGSSCVHLLLWAAVVSEHLLWLRGYLLERVFGFNIDFMCCCQRSCVLMNWNFWIKSLCY